MKRVIGGMLYNTETAELVCDVSPPSSGRGDFRFEATHLYRTKKGNWFVAGHGNAMSRWARSTDGQNGRAPGEGIEPCYSDSEVIELLEHYCHGTDVLEKYFAAQIEEA